MLGKEIIKSIIQRRNYPPTHEEQIDELAHSALKALFDFGSKTEEELLNQYPPGLRENVKKALKFLASKDWIKENERGKWVCINVGFALTPTKYRKRVGML